MTVTLDIAESTALDLRQALEVAIPAEPGAGGGVGQAGLILVDEQRLLGLQQRVAALEQGGDTGLGPRVEALESLTDGMPDFGQRLAAVEQRLAGGRILIDVHGNNTHAERQTDVPIDNGSPYTKRVLMSERITDLRKDDLLVVTAEFQVSHQHSFAVMITSEIRMGETTAVFNGPKVAENNGANFTGQQHHHRVTRAGSWIANKDYGNDLRVNLIYWTSSTAATSGQRLKIDQNRGRLVIRHYR